MPARLLKSVFVLVVLTIWSAATLHCGLEASGVWAHSEQASTADDCSRDVCGLVEDAGYAQPQADLKAPVPQLNVEFCLDCLNAALAELPRLEAPAPCFAADRHPPTWMPDRHAVRRTALPARAPTARV